MPLRSIRLDSDALDRPLPRRISRISMLRRYTFRGANTNVRPSCQKLEQERRTEADSSGQSEKKKPVQAVDTRRVSRGFTLLFIVGSRGRNDRRLLQNLRALQEEADTSFRFERSRSRGDTQQTLVRSNFRLYGLFTV